MVKRVRSFWKRKGAGYLNTSHIIIIVRFPASFSERIPFQNSQFWTQTQWACAPQYVSFHDNPKYSKALCIPHSAFRVKVMGLSKTNTVFGFHQRHARYWLEQPCLTPCPFPYTQNGEFLIHPWIGFNCMDLKEISRILYVCVCVQKVLTDLHRW